MAKTTTSKGESTMTEATATETKAKRTRKPADPNAPKPKAFIVYSIDDAAGVVFHAVTWSAEEALGVMENIPGSKYKTSPVSGRKPLAARA